MADRTVVVRLVAMVGQYQAAMAAAMASTNALNSSVAATNSRIIAGNSRVAASTGRLAQAQRSALNGTTSAFGQMRSLAVGMGIPLAIGAAAKTFLDFEQQMARVSSVVPDALGRSAVGMKALHDQALEAGQQYGFTAVEVGKAQEELLKAGRGTAQVLGGELTAALSLAAAGSIELDESAKILATTLTIFKDDNLTAVEVADRLTQSANATVTGVGELGTALSYVGPIAASLKIPFDETITSLSLFAQAGIDGDRAGTGMRGMLTNLLSPSAMARKEMQLLGINLFDSEKRFVGMAGAAEELKIELGKLDPKRQADAIGRLTTNASMPAFIVMMTAGQQGVKDMDTLLDAQEKAHEVAKKRTDSITGDFKKLGGAIGESVIRVGEAATPVLTTVATSLTAVTKGFADAGGAAQIAMLAAGAFLWRGRQKLQPDSRFSQRFTGAGQNLGLARHYQTIANETRAAALRANQAMALMTPGSRAANQQTSVVRGLDQQARAAARVADGYRGASGAVGRFAANVGSAQGALGKTMTILGGGTGLLAGGAKSGLGSLVGALGGAAGVGIMGGLIGFSMIASDMEKASRKAQESKLRIEQGAAALTELGVHYATTGSFSDDFSKKLLQGNEPLKNLTKHAADYGITLNQVAEASIGNTAAQGDIDKVYRDRAKALRQLEVETARQDGDLTAKQRAAMDELGVKPNPKRGILGMHADEGKRASLALNAAMKFTEEERKIWDKKFRDDAVIEDAMQRAKKWEMGKQFAKFGVDATGASQAVTAMMENLTIMDSVDAKFSERIGAMSGNLRNLTNSLTVVSSATAGFWKATKGDLPEAFKDAKGGKVKAKIDPVTRGFDLKDDQGIAQFEALNAMAQKAADTAETVFTTTAAAGKNTAAAMATAGTVATAAYTDMRNSAADALRGLDMTESQIKGVLDMTFALPSDIAMHVDAPGADALYADLRKIHSTIVSMPSGQVKIVSNTKAEAEQISQFGGKLQAIPGTKKFEIIFDSPGSLQAALDKFGDFKNPPPIEVPVVPKFNFGDQFSQIPKSIAAPKIATPSSAPIKLDPTLGPTPAVPNAPIKLDPTVGPVPPIPDTTVQVHPQLSGSVFVPPTTVWVTPRLTSPIPSSIAAPPARRWGGIDSYGMGGIRDAKIGKGDLIHWAEPETGGEAYIPRLGDRGRSKAILETAASWYGLGLHQMAAGGITSFAEGGLSGFTAGPAVPLGEFLSRYMGAPDNWSTQRTDAMIEQRDAALAVKEAEIALREVQKDSKHTAMDLTRAQNALTDARRNAATAYGQLAKANLSPRDQFKAALDVGVRDTGRFIGNLNTLAGQGYGALAMQLLQMGGPEAEAIAAGAVTWPRSVAMRMEKQAQTAQGQQKLLENMPSMLAIRAAMKKGQSYDQLLGSGVATAGELNAALEAMKAELSKTPAGRAMLAAMSGGQSKALSAALRGYPTGIDVSGGRAALAPAVVQPSGVPAFSKPAGAGAVQITVKGEGVLSNMIEATVDGRLVTVTKAVTHGSLVG